MKREVDNILDMYLYVHVKIVFLTRNCIARFISYSLYDLFFPLFSDGVAIKYEAERGRYAVAARGDFPTKSIAVKYYTKRT